MRGVKYFKKYELYMAKREGEEIDKVVIPECLRAHILATHHNSDIAGHQGERRTFLQIRLFFYWPGMRRDVLRWVKACLACRRRKTPRPMRQGITEAALSSYPNETVAMDIIGRFSTTDDGFEWVLTMIDTFTRWVVAVPLKDRSSNSVAETIYKY